MITNVMNDFNKELPQDLQKFLPTSDAILQQSTCEKKEVEQAEREDIAVSKYHPVGVAGVQRDQVDSDPEFPTQPGKGG